MGIESADVSSYKFGEIRNVREMVITPSSTNAKELAAGRAGASLGLVLELPAAGVVDVGPAAALAGVETGAEGATGAGAGTGPSVAVL